MRKWTSSIRRRPQPRRGRTRPRLLGAALLVLFAFATPAEACFPWCIFGVRQPDSPPSAPQAQESIDLLARGGEIVVRSPIQSPHLQLREQEVRRAFGLAYGRQNLVDRERALQAWASTIRSPVEEDGQRTYQYSYDPQHEIEAIVVPTNIGWERRPDTLISQL